MKRYDSYKDSGVKWLGEIPSHWEMRKMKFSFEEKSDKGYPTLPLLAATQNHGVIKKDDYENRTVEATKSLDSLKKVEKGDFVISLRSFQGGIELSYCRGIISPAYTVLRPTHIKGCYFKYLGKSPIFIQLLKSMVTGIREGQNIDYAKLRENQLPIPSLKEQNAIASYLDVATSKIDEAIAQQQKMIDLLNERKQIIINKAVTKGLNPNASMKDSGVEWIGNIPEHWECRRIRYIGEANNGLTYSPTDIVGDGMGTLVLRSSNIKDGKLVFEDNVFVKITPDKLKVKRGDIIICSRNGSASLVGKCAIVEEELNASFGAFMMRFRSKHYSKYIYYLLTAAISHYKQLFATSTINQLTLGIFADIKMPIVLDGSEQKLISDKLDSVCGSIDSLIETANKQISLLQERKQIIINDIVTGKVRVI